MRKPLKKKESRETLLRFDRVVLHHGHSYRCSLEATSSLKVGL